MICRLIQEMDTPFQELKAQIPYSGIRSRMANTSILQLNCTIYQKIPTSISNRSMPNKELIIYHLLSLCRFIPTSKTGLGFLAATR